MKQYTWYRFEFEDGYVTICRGMDRTEMKWEVIRHGKLISQTFHSYA